MNKFMLMSVAMLLIATTTGCGWCGLGRRTQTVAMPLAPACPPGCECDPCHSSGTFAPAGVFGHPTSVPVFGG